MRTFYVYVLYATANATNVLRVPVLSRTGPYEPLDGNVPGREIATTNRPRTRTTRRHGNENGPTQQRNAREENANDSPEIDT